MKNSIVIGFGALRTNLLRTTLSTLGVIIGVASLVAILSVTEGLESFSRAQIERTTDLQQIVITPKLTDVVNGVSIRRLKPVELTPGDIRGMAEAAGDKAVLALTYSGSAWLTVPGDTVEIPAVVTATDPEAGRLMEATIHEGRFLTAEDLSADAPMLVVTPRAARQLFPGDSTSPYVGRTVTGLGVQFTIVGVAEPAKDEEIARVFVPFTPRMKGLLGANGEKPTVAIAKVWQVEDGPAVRKRIEAWLDEHYGNHDKDFVVASRQQRIEQVAQAMFVFKLVMGAITGISLIVGGIGIMNILLASVSERTREIGIRRATGARASEIMLQFLAESVAISGLGSLVGVVVGYLGSVVITAIIRSLTNAPFHTSFTWTAVVVAVAAACFVGITFGIYPARKASKLSPADAIRYE